MRECERVHPAYPHPHPHPLPAGRGNFPWPCIKVIIAEASVLPGYGFFAYAGLRLRMTDNRKTLLRRVKVWLVVAPRAKLESLAGATADLTPWPPSLKGKGEISSPPWQSSLEVR
jgi:hypothetical protein